MTRQTEIQSSDLTLNKLYCGLETVLLRTDSLATANIGLMKWLGHCLAARSVNY